MRYFFEGICCEHDWERESIPGHPDAVETRGYVDTGWEVCRKGCGASCKRGSDGQIVMYEVDIPDQRNGQEEQR